MAILFGLVLVFCVLAVAHTYLFYPLWVTSGRGRRMLGEEQKSKESLKQKSLPPVFVLMAAHNEAAVIEEKLISLQGQDYAGPLTFLIGSDRSTDGTNEMLQTFAATDDRFRPTYFTTRQGKPAIINQLAAAAIKTTPTGAIFVISDASVMLKPNTIQELVWPMMTNKRIGVVDATMVQVGGQVSGVGASETTYINREVAIKQAESRRWQTMIGPFGGCWAIRAAAYTPVPDNFLVDDFFLCMAAYEQGFRGVTSERAQVEEAVGQVMREEFRRKVRISSGNWQNLVRFRRLWWFPTKNTLAFAFFSHKVLRWWTPFFMLIGVICVVLLVVSLGLNHWVSGLLILILTGAAAMVLADLLLQALNLHVRLLRGLRYFLAMNLALLVGFFRFLTGIKTNVWQPTQRYGTKDD
ncbi:MAG: glycosyltransferase [Bacteroidota bacterium]